ncbi:MAG: amino acid permease [Thiohalocapsa sp.]|nr:amino acid permease [Thiohalocapsa sp.]
MPPPRAFLDFRAATLLVVANMVGTGVFTTLGLQAAGVQDATALMLLWVLGGVVAVCGALSYAVLAAALPRSGGEYNFLTRIYGPALGEMAGWISSTVGFAAPVALAAMAFGRYVATFLAVDPLWTALAAVLAMTAVHAFDLDLGRRFQVLSTALKVAIIVVFCIAGLLVAPAPGALSVVAGQDTLAAVMTPAFGLSLVFVSYAYSGWNAATYVTAEVRSPQRLVPRALIAGTLLVTLLYLALNMVFLRTVPLESLAGTVEVGALSAGYVFGAEGGKIMSAALSLLLLSTMSAMVLAGPRVIEAMAEDRPRLSFFSARNVRGAPTRAVVLQQGIAVSLVLTDSFAAVLALAGFTLTLFALLTVAGVVVLRVREPGLPRPFRIPLYPLPPAIYALLSLISLVMVGVEQPGPVFAGLALLLLWWAVLRARAAAALRSRR